MANFVTIGCLGPQPLRGNEGELAERTVERMIRHWKSELERVLPEQVDIVVLPEAADSPTPRAMDVKKWAEYYRLRGNKVRHMLEETAVKHSCHIVYPSLTEMEDGSWRNAATWIDRDGQVLGSYHKHYFPQEEMEYEEILCGRDTPVFDCDFGRAACAICFDLHFDELRQKYVDAKPDLIVFPSKYHGGLMQNYWAYSCRSYFASAVVGSPCTIVSPVGEILAAGTNYEHFAIARVNLDYAILGNGPNRNKFAAMKQKYGPSVRIHMPAYLGVTFISSEVDEFTVQDVIQEFELETQDDYLQRSRTYLKTPGRIGS
jgi:predicted amidohydrolase